MFPATQTVVNRSLSFNIAAVSSVVVDLPFVPVIATIGAGQTLAATSNSARIGIFCARASHRIGISSGTPGETTMKSASAMHAVGCPPRYFWISPGSENTLSAAISADNAADVRVSVSVTTAPCVCNNFAAATPLRFKPKTVTCFPCNLIFCSKTERVYFFEEKA